MAYLPTAPDDIAANSVRSGGIVSNQLGRGINSQARGDILSTSGRRQDGSITQENIQPPYFSLTPIERDEIAKQNSYVQGIITGRMHRISGIDWTIKPKGEKEDDFIQAMKMRHQQYKETAGAPELGYKVFAMRQKAILRQNLPDLLPDLSNFQSSLRRWRLRYKSKVKTSSQQVYDWVNQANDQDDFEEFQKKWVYDLQIHGSSAIYWDLQSTMISQSFYMLPGGTVMQVREPYAGPGIAWVQMVPGYETKIYYENEMVYDTYIPISARSYGMVPLDALVNKIAETLLFDRLAAERADGTRPPEKAVIFGEKSPIPGFGDGGAQGFEVPLPTDVQGRLEQKFNTERQNAIAVISGIGTPQILDLSRADTFAAQNERQTRLLKDIALVFNVSNNEINETGSEGTSGRSVSESLERIDKEKGIGPIIRIIDKTMTNKILPRRFGNYWEFSHSGGMSEIEQVELDTKKLNSGSYDVNEVRESRGDDPYEGEEFDKPQGAQQAMNQIGSMFGGGM